MLKLTIKSILGRKIRFALTSFAIIIGVAFSVASFVLTDSLTNTFNKISTSIGQGYTIAGPAGSRQFTLVGTVAFGTPDNTLAGAVLSAFDTPTAQDFLAKGAFYDSIAVAVDNPSDVKAVAQRLESELAQNIE